MRRSKLGQTLKTIVLLLSVLNLVVLSRAEVTSNNEESLINEEEQQTNKQNEQENTITNQKSNTATQINDSEEQHKKEPKKEEKIPEPKSTTDAATEPTQAGPFIDLLGPKLFSFEIESTDDTKVKINSHYTNDVIQDTDVIGLYFSADWCGPCQQFTPELVTYYNRITTKRKKKFKIIWISRCKSYETYIQFFVSKFDTSWYALPLEDASGLIGQTLSNLYKVKGIPSLVFLDDVGNVITTEARNMIPNDKAGIGFPYRNPIITLYHNVIPKSLRLIVRNYGVGVKKQVYGVLLQKKKKKQKVLDMLKSKQIKV